MGWWDLLGYGDTAPPDETTLPCKRGWKLVVGVTSNTGTWPANKVRIHVLQGRNQQGETSSTETANSLTEIYEGRGQREFLVEVSFRRARNWKLVESKTIIVSDRPQPYRVDLVITTGHDIRFEVVDDMTRRIVPNVAVRATLPGNDVKNATTDKALVRFITATEGTCVLDQLEHDVTYLVTNFDEKIR